MGKADELHGKLDKMEKEKHQARKRSIGGKVNSNYADEEEAEEEGIMAVEYGGMANSPEDDNLYETRVWDNQ